MRVHLVQLLDTAGRRSVCAFDEDGTAFRLGGVDSVHELALRALDAGRALADEIRERRIEEVVDVDAALADGRLLPAIDHPDPAHLLLSGTGLTHLGSAEGRDRMHRAAAGDRETDSMRMFRMGLEGGKPKGGRPGVQPEWFYKGSGEGIVGPGAPLRAPAFAEDGSEEPEIAGIYIIDTCGVPRRIGFCLANEFSDHVIERGNYLWLAHSKLRPAALGAEIVGELPPDVRGTSRIRRNGSVLWEKPFLTGEANMSHTLANLEHHHFKYALFRRPGDIHVHFFGTATLSFADGVRTRDGDIFEIEAPPFRLPLYNPLGSADAPPDAARPL
jgi:hypothetical protein